jgi:1,4-dihydroxy-2-naphthoyl-CoA hydrolase
MFRFERAELRAAPAPRFEASYRVRFQDVDAAGLLFFARYLDYVHDTYVAWLEAIGQPLPRVLAERSWAAPLRHAECDYLQPVRFGDELRVQLVLAHIASTEISLGFRLALGPSPLGSGQTVALAQTVHTFVDLKTLERKEVPEEIRAALAELVP